MDKIIKVKQVPDDYAISTGLDKYGKSRMPHCRDTYQAAQGYDLRYQTGIDEDASYILSIKDDEERERKVLEIKTLRASLERLLRKDLSGTSDFWETFFINISTDEDLILNMSNPLDVVKYHVLVANGLAAPNFESSGMPQFRNAKYYCFTEERFEQQNISAQKQRDKARAALLEMSQNDDKMLLIGQYLEGFKYKKGMKSDTYYSMLSNFINDTKNPDNVEAFIKASNTPVEDLQYKITVDKAIKSKKIKFKDGQYYRGGVNLGKNLIEVLDNLKSPEYANEFISIHEEVS